MASFRKLKQITLKSLHFAVVARTSVEKSAKEYLSGSVIEFGRESKFLVQSYLWWEDLS